MIVMLGICWKTTEREFILGSAALSDVQTRPFNLEEHRKDENY